MKKFLLSAAMLMAGMGAWAQDATDERFALWYQAYMSLAGSSLNQVGYPLNSSNGYTALSDCLESITDPYNIDDEQYLNLSVAINLFCNSDILMPEDGKAYTITGISDPQQSKIGWGDKSYLPKGSTEGVGAEFVCKKTDDGKYLFVSDNGYYLSWEGTSGTSNTKNVYDENAQQLFTLEKATVANTSGDVEGLTNLGLIGKFSFKASNDNYLMYNLTDGTPYSAGEDGTKCYYTHDETQDAVTAFFKLDPATGYTANQFTVTEEAVLGNTRVGTFYSPNYATTMPEGYTAYWANSVAGGKVNLTKLTDIPANTAVVVTGAGSAEPLLALPSTANPESSTVTGNKLFGFSENKDVTSTDYNGKTGETGSVYTLARGASGDVAFYRYNADQFAAGKAYLDAGDVDASARSLVFNFGGDTETTIESIQGAESAADAVVYDLAGRRVQGAQKGLYIVNGKVVIK